MSYCLDITRLPTMVNLNKRGVIMVSSLCALCAKVDETEDHLFGQCDVFRLLLKDFCYWWNVSPMPSDLSCMKNWGSLLNLKGNKEMIFRAAIYVLWWTMWNIRNNKVFHSFTLVNFGNVQDVSYFWIKNRMGNKFSISWEA